MTHPTEKAPIPWAEDPSRCEKQDCPEEGTEERTIGKRTVWHCPTHTTHDNGDHQ